MEMQVGASFHYDLRALALTSDDSCSLWSRSNLHACQPNFIPFGHPMQVNASVVVYFKY